jgi:arylsulfatase A-like enzyme
MKSLRLLILTIAAIAPLSHVEAQPPPARPNLIYILLDDVRWDEFGAVGHPWAKTPNFDRIAKEGATFRNAFSATPLCSPSRGTILTGQYAHTHGIIDNVERGPRSHQLVTFPRLLHDAGYTAAFIGKWHMGVDDTARPGFDYWCALQGQGYYFDPEVNENGVRRKIAGYTTDVFTDLAVKFITQKHEKPYILFLAHKAVHPNVFQNPDGSVLGGRHGADDYTPAERHKDLYTGVKIQRRPNAKSYGEGKPALLRKFPGVEPLGPTTGTDDATIIRRQRLLAAADEGMGELFRALERTGQLDSTVIVVTSDHGMFYGEHGLERERRLAYEESIRIPLFVRYPPLIKSGTEIVANALTIDHGPTLLDLGGVTTPATMHGRSLVPLFKSGSRIPNGWPRSFLIEYYSDTVFPRLVKMGYKAVRTDRWKYIRYTELEGMDELYDLAADPYEMRNVIASEPAALAAMQRELDAALRRTPPVTY